MKKSAFIAFAIFTVGYAPLYALANDNAETLYVQETCERLANEDNSDTDWSIVFDDCMAEHDQIVEDSTWEEPPTDDEDISESDILDQ